VCGNFLQGAGTPGTERDIVFLTADSEKVKKKKKTADTQ
jgi:hypothetical protein